MENNIKCPKCGTLNSLDSKFCSNCGNKLPEPKIKCPKCGKLNSTKSKFCSYCGTSLLKNNVKAKASKTSDKVLHIIALSLMGLTLLLTVLGCFGDVFKAVSSTGTASASTSQSISWFFKELWDNVNLLKNSPSYGISMFEAILHILSWLFCLTMTIFVLITSLVSISKDPHGTSFKLNKKVSFLLLGIIPYLAITSIYLFTENSTLSLTVKTTYSWGTILLIVSMFIAIVSTILEDISTNNKKDFKYLIFNKLTILFVAFIAVFGFSSISIYTVKAEVASTSIGSSTSLNVFQIMELANKLRYSNKDLAMSIISVIFMLGSLALLMVNAFSSKPIKRIVCFSIILALAIVSCALSLVVTKDLISTIVGGFWTASVGPSIIVMIILVVACIVFSSLTYKFKDQDN